ncbi:hypothetical protein Tco_0777560 [Tanacetum coccineum]
MIGCKAMRTLSSVEIEIMLILGLPCCLSSSSVRCLESAYLVDGTESEPLEDPIDPNDTWSHPLTVSTATSLPGRTPPTVVSYYSAGLHEIIIGEDAEDEGPTVEDEDPAAGDEGLAAGSRALVRMIRVMNSMRVYGALWPPENGLRFANEYLLCCSPVSSLNDEGHSVESDGLSLEEEEAVPGGQQEAAPVVRTAVSATLELGYGALRPRELALEEDHVYTRQPTLTTWTDPEDGMVYIDVPAYPPPAEPVQTPPSPEWTSSLLPISPSPYVVPLPVSSAETEGFLTELGAQVEMQGGLIHDHAIRLEELSSLEYEQERVAATFRAIWRPVLALESWEGQTDAQRAALWHAISDIQGKNQDLRLQLAKERRARLELAKVVGSMRRGQEPRGDA